MEKLLLLQVVVGVALLVVGAVITARQDISYRTRETLNDLLAVIGLVLMVSGLVLVVSPLLR